MKLSKAQKGAMLLMTLDPKSVGILMKRLPKETAVRMGKIMVELAESELNPNEYDDVVKEFAVKLGADTRRNVDLSGVKNLLKKSFSEAFGEAEGGAVLQKVEDVDEAVTPLAPIHQFSPEKMGSLVEVEHPQVAAILLASLPSSRASALMDRLEETKRIEVFRRMALLERPPSGLACRVLAEISDQEEEEILKSSAFEDGKSQRLRLVAEVLSMQEGSIDKSVLEAISKVDADLTQQINELMFTFDDIILIDKRAMPKLLMDFDVRELGLALKVANSKVEKHILDNLSSRVKKQIEEEQETMGSIPIADIHECQKSIAEKARSLIEAGEVKINRTRK